MYICFQRGLNCTQTCCKQTYCATTNGDCIHYIRSDLWDLYICVIVIISIVLGIPTCIRSMEFILMYKFCRIFDEDENAYVGGTTVLEGLYHCLDFRNKAPNTKAEETKSDDDLEDEFASRKFSRTLSSNLSRTIDREEQQTTVKTCCKACFCCITRNIVEGYQEMALNVRDESTIQGS